MGLLSSGLIDKEEIFPFEKTSEVIYNDTHVALYWGVDGVTTDHANAIPSPDFLLSSDSNSMYLNKLNCGIAWKHGRYLIIGERYRYALVVTFERFNNEFAHLFKKGE